MTVYARLESMGGCRAGEGTEDEEVEEASAEGAEIWLGVEEGCFFFSRAKELIRV